MSITARRLSEKEVISINCFTKTHTHSNLAELDSISGFNIQSIPSGDWKRITQIEYNKVTGKIRVSYDDV